MSQQTTHCVDFILSVLTEITAEHNMMNTKLKGQAHHIKETKCTDLQEAMSPEISTQHILPVEEWSSTQLLHKSPLLPDFLEAAFTQNPVKWPRFHALSGHSNNQHHCTALHAAVLSKQAARTTTELQKLYRNSTTNLNGTCQLGRPLETDVCYTPMYGMRLHS